jgi:type II secretory pathway component PulM
MSAYWNNLKPFEKRVVVGIAAFFFIVLNFFFVFPHFSDLAAAHARRDETEAKLTRYEKEFAQTNLYAARLRELEKENSEVGIEDQAFQFANAIQAQAGQSGVRVLSNGRINTQTNQFFLEKSQTISVQGGEAQLVDFLYKLGSGDSQIRVRELGMRPDQPRQQLVANVKLVASYQKKPTARPATRPTVPATKSGTPATKTAAPTEKSANTTTKRP